MRNVLKKNWTYFFLKIILIYLIYSEITNKNSNDKLFQTLDNFMTKKRKIILFLIKYLQINYFHIIFYENLFSINLDKYVNLIILKSNFDKKLCSDYSFFYLNN